MTLILQAMFTLWNFWLPQKSINKAHAFPRSLGILGFKMIGLIGFIIHIALPNKTIQNWQGFLLESRQCYGIPSNMSWVHTLSHRWFRSEILEVPTLIPSFGSTVSGPISANLSDLFDLWHHDSKGAEKVTNLNMAIPVSWRELIFWGGIFQFFMWFVLFRYLTSYFFPSWFHRIIHH